MDFECTASHAPVRDVDRPCAGAAYPSPDPDVRMASRAGEDQALESLEAEITELWGHINAATARFLALLAEFDRREGWAQHGLSSCAHWLNWQCGISRVAAREKVRTARALASLPKISAAFGEGRLSYSKVRALTRAATPETEDLLLHIALNGTAAHVERTVRGFRRVQRELERSEAEVLHERRYLDCRRDADGSVRVEARLSPEVAAMLFKALEVAEAQLDKRGGDEDVSAETPSTQSALERRRDVSPASVSAETSPAGFVLPPLPDEVPEGVSAETPVRSGWRRTTRRAG